MEENVFTSKEVVLREGHYYIVITLFNFCLHWGGGVTSGHTVVSKTGLGSGGKGKFMTF